MTIISDFYKGKATDQSGRNLINILAMSDEDLEKDHMYIQYLFPNREPSHINPDAPLLDDETVEEIKSRSDIIEVVRICLKRMTDFYKMDEVHPWWATENNHNYLRMTRILNTLREFGMHEELNMFFRKLLIIFGNNEVISWLTFNYWLVAVGLKQGIAGVNK